MKKNTLIKLLQDIEGNPDIVVWNGFVEEYQHIDTDLLQCELVKETVEFREKNLITEWYLNNQSAIIPIDELSKLAKNLYKKDDWKLPNPYITKEEFKQWYGNKRKKVVILNLKKRNKTHSDRTGKLRY